MSDLLGKSPRGPRRISLLRHTLDVVEAAELLFGRDTPTRLGVAWLRFFRVSSGQWQSFRINLLAAALFHDWGKANDGMQGVLHSQGGEQVIRHEHLSALLLTVDGVTPWLNRRSDVDWDIVLAAVLGHHLNAGFKDLDELPTGSARFEVLFGHKDFHEIVQAIGDRLMLCGPAPQFTASPFWAFRNLDGHLLAGAFDAGRHRQELKDRRLRRFETALRKDESRKRLLWAVRTALIAADAVGSAMPRVDTDTSNFIRSAFNDDRTCDREFVWREVIDRRTADVARVKQRAFTWNEFQTHCDNLSERSLLLAPCGSGKTLAAWRWIAAQLGRRVGRIIFLYPTRATAKEGFRDYVSWAPEADAVLMHGTADFDLQGMFTNADDSRFGNNYETDRRLYALRFWTRRVFSATVDQFLAFMQYAYGPMCLLPLLVDSVVVIDEVHSFDHAMFSALKAFLKTFDVPVLCMTATLPGDRCAELAACPMEVYDDKPDDLKGIAEAPRYRLRRTTAGEVPAAIQQALDSGRRILWVVNQVKRAQQAVRGLACDFLTGDHKQDHVHTRPGIPLLCYHSRYRLADRVRRHNAVVDAFRAGSPPALAVTTQVCEMSLDMDADLLVTEECPIISLIQRMGRCNRDRNPRHNAGEVLVYQPLDQQGRPDHLPYDVNMLTGLEAFLTSLSARSELNQVDLEAALLAAPLPIAAGDKASSFLESGPYARGGEEDFRDIEEFSVRAVLDADVCEYLSLKEARKPADGLIVPAPRRLGKRDERLPYYLAVADHTHYHAAIGFCDHSLAVSGGPS